MFFNDIVRFFKKLGPDRTADWPPVRIQHAVIDTTSHKVCGLQMPFDFDRLKTIGRPANRHAFIDRCAKYPQLGAHFWVEPDHTVVDIGICLIDVGNDGPAAQRVDVIGRGGTITLVPGTQIDLLKAILGEGTPDVDDDETVWTFRLGKFVLDVECAPEGEVRHFNYFID